MAAARRRPVFAPQHPPPVPHPLVTHRCANLEDQIITRLPAALPNPAAAAKAVAVASYLLRGQGSLEGVLQVALGLDVAGLQRRINDTRAELVQVRATVLH